MLIVGTYSKDEEYGHVKGTRGQGIHCFNPSSLTPISVTDSSICGYNPTYLLLSDKYLYCINELEKEGSITALTINQEKLELLNSVNLKSSSPCHLALSNDRLFIAVANYSSGSVQIIEIKNDSSLGSIVCEIEFGKKSRAHCVLFSPDGRFLYVADLGMDRIQHLSFDSQGRCDLVGFSQLPDNSGPRHLVLRGDSIFVVTEFSNRVHAFKRAESGQLFEICSISTLPEGAIGRFI